jgi:hypothetical protein
VHIIKVVNDLATVKEDGRDLDEWMDMYHDEYPIILFLPVGKGKLTPYAIPPCGQEHQEPDVGRARRVGTSLHPYR